MSTSLEADLENDIIFGVFAPGTRIIEDRIMEHYGAKRHAVRRAFAQLESRGLLVHRPNRGVEVVDFTPDEVDALYEVRIVLETAAAARTALPVAPEMIAELEAVADRHADAVARKTFREVFWLNQTFHELQFSCCENERLASLIATHARMAQPIRVVKYDDVAHMTDVVAQHRKIIATMSGTDTDAYVAATREHLPASAEAYRTLYSHRFGGAQAAG
jgi:DNA-binding GntR family transcriptional regulator